MSSRDPNLFGDSPSDRRNSEADGFDVPLELYFARDHGDPETIAAQASLEAGVLDRVGSERGFVSSRQRRLIRAGRGVVLMSALCALLAAAVADRLGVAPWNPSPSDGTAGPVSGLVASTSEETAVTIERARELRDRLLRVVEAPTISEPPSLVAVTLRPAPTDAPAKLRLKTTGFAAADTPSNGGPYLTAKGFGITTVSSVTTIIRFEDGFSVPAMAGAASSELRWPASRAVTASVVSFDGGARCKPATLSPEWYACSRSDAPR